MRKIVVLLPLLCGLICSRSFARQDPAACGTHAERTREELFLHRSSAGRRPLVNSHGSVSQIAQPAPRLARDIGQIAVIDDSDGVIGRRNPFDLNQKTVAFLPANASASSYTFQVTGSTYDEGAAQAGQHLTLKDDDSKQIDLPFAFPFFAANYQKIFINSDGNVTFTAGDPATSGRSLGRLTAGVPRIAPLFTDLDPSVSSQGVFATADATRFTVSWVRVPVFSDSGAGRPQTFQLRLYPNGRIEMTWLDTTVTDAVVGIGPGHLQGTASLLSFTAGSPGPLSGAIAERFSGSDAVDIVTTAQKFYETHQDAYDYLVIFNAEGVAAGSGVVAFEVTARNSRTGYGDDLVDSGQEFGSAKRLQAVLNMGPLSQYPADPNAIVPARVLSRDTPLTVLGHEAGHLFLAFASVRDANDPNGQPMLGRALVHWSFLFNSEASLLEGNRIQDNGADASPRFTTVGTVQGYSALDQYLMGLRMPQEVPPMFFVTNSPEIGTGSRAPQNGVSFNGRRRDFTIDELIDTVGRRTPDSTVAQRRFRFGFLLIVPAGTTPSGDQLAQVETYRSNFESFYQHATSDRGAAEATLKRAVHLSAYPAAGVVAGGTATASVSVETPGASALTILLHTNSGAISTPAAVTIPAGANIATFSYTGVRSGVDTITAEPADSSYETAFAKIQVLGSAEALHLEVVSGDKQTAIPGKALAEPIVVRVTDINELAYPNVTVSSDLAGAAISDEAGLAHFNWTPGPANELTISVAGGPSLTVMSLGTPAFALDAVVNAASFAPGISPGSIATIFGANLGNASVSVNGTPATVFFSNNRQVNFLAPDRIPEGLADVVVTTSAGSTSPVRVSVMGLSPGLFAAINRGAYVEIYATGLGPVKDGLTVTAPQVFIGSTEATVVYSGLAPGFAGLYQVKVVGPVEAGSPISLQIAGKASNVVRVL